MEFEFGYPFTGKRLQAVKEFLQENHLSYDCGITFTVNLLLDGAIIATGSLEGGVLKCIAVSSAYQGQDLTAKVVTELTKEAFRLGREHLFLFTKPINGPYFSPLGFYELARTPDILLMENVRGGIDRFVSSLERPCARGVIGAAVVHCNPFTNGHRYLLETAAKQCSLLHVFVLSHHGGPFSPEDRMALVQAGTQDISNLVLHPTSEYLISPVTCPEYFLQGGQDPRQIHCRLDLELFVRYFAPALHITRRFVGTEPFSPVTAQYNQAMQAFLPQHGIEVIEIPRLCQDGVPISASAVRRLWREGALQALRPLVPAATYAYLCSHSPSQQKGEP